jgi:hypothetical protein
MSEEDYVSTQVYERLLEQNDKLESEIVRKDELIADLWQYIPHWVEDSNFIDQNTYMGFEARVKQEEVD